MQQSFVTSCFRLFMLEEISYHLWLFCWQFFLLNKNELFRVSWQVFNEIRSPYFSHAKWWKSCRYRVRRCISKLKYISMEVFLIANIFLVLKLPTIDIDLFASLNITFDDAAIERWLLLISLIASCCCCGPTFYAHFISIRIKYNVKTIRNPKFWNRIDHHHFFFSGKRKQKILRKKLLA